MSKEIKYPCCMKNKRNGLKVLFVERNKGYIQENKYSFKVDDVIEIVDSENGYWKPYEPSRFKDGTIVWCWNNVQQTPIPKRWDAINNTVCWDDGTRNGYNYNNYKLFEGELPYELPKIKG